MEWLSGLPVGEITGPAALVLVAVLVITDKLVWHTRLAKAEAARERWERVALEVLDVTGRLTVQAEVTNDVLTAALPPPPRETPPT